MDQVRIEKDFIHHLPLYKNVIKGDWKSVQSAFEENPSLITARITYLDETLLNLAVRTRAPVLFIRKLVGMMAVSDLEASDVDNDTALHCSAIVGYTEVAKILVAKNPGLTQFRGLLNMTPVHRAAMCGYKDTVWFLLKATRRHDPSPLTGKSGVMLLNTLIIAELYDVAIYLLRCYPDLAIHQDEEGRGSALYQLALKPRTFLSGSQLGFLQRLWYKFIVCRKEDLENPEYDQQEPRKFGFLQNIYDTKLMHLQAVELAKMLCTEIIKSTSMEDSLLATPIIKAARLGIHELVLEILKAFPDAVWFGDNDGSIFQFAVLFRKEKVYNIVHQLSFPKHVALSFKDENGNNILHLAGRLQPSNRISGAALQMQRELQWFKEVENVVPPSFKEVQNKDGKTPRELFTEEHRELVQKGEKWMKNTASSCMVVAALITTVVFAAAFTLPGGNKSDDGLPVFLNNLSFLIFAVSNALALFASSTSVLMFLGILTSRYSEEDFLRALPMRLCIGLVTLFLSIALMLAAFSSSLHIFLVHRLNWVAAPIILLACIPLTLFAFLQFPLLVEIVSLTFGPSIFRQQSKEIVC